MNRKLILEDLIIRLSEKSNLSPEATTQFLKSFISVAASAIVNDGILTIGKIGKFETVTAADGGNETLKFVADQEIADRVNAPFSLFEAVEINDGVTFDTPAEPVATPLPPEPAEPAQPEPAQPEPAQPEPAEPEPDEPEPDEPEPDEPEPDEPEPDEIKIEVVTTTPPVEEEPIVEEPAVEEEPIVEEPAVEEESIVEEPAMEEKPVFEAPIIEEPAVEEPVEEEAIEDEAGETEPKHCETKTVYVHQPITPPSHHRYCGIAALLTVAVLVVGAYFFGLFTPAIAEWALSRLDNRATTIVVEPNPQPVATPAESPADTTTASAPTEADNTEPQAVATPDAATPASSSQRVDTITTKYYITHMAKRYYGNEAFWSYIYKENESKFGHPERSVPGTVVVIPPASKYGIDANNPESVKKARQLGVEIYQKHSK